MTADQSVTTPKLCVSDNPNDPAPVCVAKTQLAALLSQSTAANTPISVSSSASNSRDASPQNPLSDFSKSVSSTSAAGSPPTIVIMGANPAVIHLGDSYADLCATIAGPTDADKNLGLKYLLNGQLVSNIVLDTSKVATDTIDYVTTVRRSYRRSSPRRKESAQPLVRKAQLLLDMADSSGAYQKLLARNLV